jgi:hypothetical protein
VLTLRALRQWKSVHSLTGTLRHFRFAHSYGILWEDHTQHSPLQRSSANHVMLASPGPLLFPQPIYVLCHWALGWLFSPELTGQYGKLVVMQNSNQTPSFLQIACSPIVGLIFTVKYLLCGLANNLPHTYTKAYCCFGSDACGAVLQATS